MPEVFYLYSQKNGVSPDPVSRPGNVASSILILFV